MILRYLVFALLISVTNTLVAQFGYTSPPPAPIPTEPELFYVPFNDHGKWGYADTLGNIVISPQFDGASLFQKQAHYDEFIINARVKTKEGVIAIGQDGKSILPKNTVLALDRQYSIDGTPKLLWFIANKKKRIALFDPISKRKPEFKYSSIPAATLQGGRKDPIILKSRKTRELERYLPEQNRFITTEFAQIFRMHTEKNRYTSKLYAETNLGDTLQFLQRRDTFIQANFRPGDKYIVVAPQKQQATGKVQPPEFEDATFEDNAYTVRGDLQIQLRNKFKVDTILQESRIGRYLSSKYGISKLYLAKRNGKYGVVDQSQKVQLPFIYDRIDILGNGTEAAIYLNGKVGRKLFFTIYPTIEPEFDYLTEFNSFRVTPRWRFVVYYGIIDNQKVYVGENGVKYFNLD